MFPAFSRMQDEPARILGALNRVNQVLAAIAFPTLTGLAILAPEFTSVVLGSKWAGTEDVIRVLALGGMALALQRVNFSVLSARGYTRLIMWVGAGALGSTVVAILVAYPFGLVATVAALAAQTLVLQAVIMSVTAGALDARFRDLAAHSYESPPPTGVMAASVVLVAESLRAVGVGRRRDPPGRDRHRSARCSSRSTPPARARLVDELKGFVRHGRRSTDTREETASTTASTLAPGRTRISMNRPTSNGSPAVSFGLPVRNGAPTIRQARRSVLAQTFEDWELVISDNQSTDGTSEICAAFAAQDERIRHIPSDRDLSIHENFRAAFHHTRGTYFRWHGDDDWLEPEYAARAVATLDEHPRGLFSARRFSSTTATDSRYR